MGQAAPTPSSCIVSPAAGISGSGRMLASGIAGVKGHSGGKSGASFSIFFRDGLRFTGHMSAS